MHCKKFIYRTLLIISFAPSLLLLAACGSGVYYGDPAYYDDGPYYGYGPGYVSYGHYRPYYSDKNHQWSRDRYAWDHRSDHHDSRPPNVGHFNGPHPEPAAHGTPEIHSGGFNSGGGPPHGGGPIGGHGGGEPHR